MRQTGFVGRRRHSAARAAGLAAAGVAFAALAGCAMSPLDTRAGYEAVEEGVTAAPMAELPAAAGAVTAVLQSKVGGVLTQRIVLKGDPGVAGENAIVVRVDQSPGPQDLDGPYGIPTHAMIASELDSAMPGVEMQLSQTFARNSFGPFGYAIGHPNKRVTCIYAWQWGMWKPGKLGDAPSGAPSMPVQPTSVRVRLCRSTIGEAEILPMLRQMEVFAPGSRVAYADPASPVGEAGGDALAAAGVGYFVASGQTQRERIEAPRERRHRRVAHYGRHHRRVAEIEERAAAVDGQPLGHEAGGGVVVPMPGGLAPTAPAAADIPSSNPLLAPLSAVPTARTAVDDMPLPGRAAPVHPAGAQRGSIPLPD
jgi:hypothetical protein